MSFISTQGPCLQGSRTLQDINPDPDGKLLKAPDNQTSKWQFMILLTAFTVYLFYVLSFFSRIINSTSFIIGSAKEIFIV